MKQRLLLGLGMTALFMLPAMGSHGEDIVGETFILPEDMCSFVRQHNPSFTIEVAEAYWDVAERYGIRGDVALCQAIIETGWFKFMDGTAVTPDQYNFCGLGVTKHGVKGNSFSTMEEGVTAQIQHLYAYATNAALPQGEALVDQRFALVPRGCAPTWDDLSGRWAMNKHYGEDIMRIYRQLLDFTRKLYPETQDQ